MANAEEQEPESRSVSPWLTGGIPVDRMPRWLTLAVGASLVIGFTALGIAAWVFGWLDQETMEDLGYLGIFISNFLPHVSVFLPLPGLAAVGHALVVWGVENLNPVAVVAIATVANTVAEFTSYWAGMTGKTASEVKPISLPGAPGRFARWSWGKAETLMAHYGFLTLLVLSAVPNPVFEVSGIIAGATRMNFAMFTLALLIGHFIRVMTIVIVGQEIVDWANI